MGSKLIPRAMVLVSLVLIVISGKSALQCAVEQRIGGSVRLRAPRVPCHARHSSHCCRMNGAPCTSCADRETLRLEELEFDGLPSRIMANLVLAAVLGLLGGVQYWGVFEPIRLADSKR